MNSRNMSEEEKECKADFELKKPEEMDDREFEEFYDKNWQKYDQEAELNESLSRM